MPGLSASTQVIPRKPCIRQRRQARHAVTAQLFYPVRRSGFAAFPPKWTYAQIAATQRAGAFPVKKVHFSANTVAADDRKQRRQAANRRRRIVAAQSIPRPNCQPVKEALYSLPNIRQPLCRRLKRF